MAQQVMKYRILVSSPSDVDTERNSLREVVSELNRTYGHQKGVILELVGWETNAAPGASTADVQTLIDNDLGEDYDLFIGFLWKRFGTRTATYGSGTEQEFMNAYKRFKESPASLQILFYFSKSPFSLDDVDIDQISKVKGFKESLGSKDVLYWDYSTIEQLHRFLRMHIPMRIDRLHDSQRQLPSPQSAIEPAELDSDVVEDGFLDLSETIEDTMVDAIDTMRRISDAIEWVGKELSIKSNELSRISSTRQNVGTKELRKFFERTATVMNDFSTRIAPNIPILLRHFEIVSDALISMVEIQRADFNGASQESVDETAESLLTMNESLVNGMNGIQSFLGSVVALPRVSKDLNRARRNVESVLTDLISNMETMHSLITEVHRNMTNSVDDK